jgi:hypothetical protein
MAYVAGRFARERRRAELSFSHHAEVAALAPDEQEVWLERAQASGLSARASQRELRNAGGAPGARGRARWKTPSSSRARSVSPGGPPSANAARESHPPNAFGARRSPADGLAPRGKRRRHACLPVPRVSRCQRRSRASDTWAPPCVRPGAGHTYPPRASPSAGRHRAGGAR